MRKFILNLQFLFRPSYWVMNYRYSKEVDELMNYLLDNFEFTKTERYTAYLGVVEIWIGNQPYACMGPYHCLYEDVRPSRLTIKRGIDKLNKSKAEEYLKTISDMRNKIESK